VEAPLDIDIAGLVSEAIKLQPTSGEADDDEGVYEFIVERLRGYVMDGFGVSAEMFEAVRARRPLSLVDFVDRLQAVQAFVELESATSLAAANKRIGNILRQADFDGDQALREDLLADPAEVDLFAEIRSAEKDVGPLVRARAYGETLTRLAALRSAVDRFFDDVMVMVDDEELRLNRLALLSRLRNLFLDVADISRLAIK
jgi:glycyl-tRNA synthetase beta chain